MKNLFIFCFCLMGLNLKAEDYPIIFLHGNKSEAVPEVSGDKRKGGWKTWYPTDIYGNPTYPTAMTKIVGYKGYQYGLKVDGSPAITCDESTQLQPWQGMKRIFNFSYYHPDGSPGAIGSNGNLIPNSSWEEGIYQDVVSQGSWAENLADFIDKVLEATGAEKVDIVAHCMGGLVARAAIKYYGCANKVRKLLMIATPNYGVKPGFVAYVVMDIVNKWPLWMHRGEGLEMGIDKELEEVSFSTSPPYIHIEYGETYDTTFRNIYTGETGSWTALLNNGDWASSVEYAIITANRNPYGFGLGYRMV